MGVEPTTFGTTIRRSNQLSYYLRVFFGRAKVTINALNATEKFLQSSRYSIRRPAAMSTREGCFSPEVAVFFKAAYRQMLFGTVKRKDTAPASAVRRPEALCK